VRDLLRRPAGRAVVGGVIAVAVWAVLAQVLSHGAPAGIILQGAVLGAINALIALSIVLIYRANRVINFAAADFGAVAAILAIELHIKIHLNYFLAVAAGLAAAAVIGGIVEALILRRFSNAPRLIVAVVTLGVAQILNALSIIIPIVWSSGSNSGTFNTPFTIQFRVFPVLFNGNYVVALIIVPVVMVALTWFLRYTNYGVAIRAAADNGDRARLLGVPVKRLSTVVWVITGMMSAMAALLRVPILGFVSFSSVSGSGPSLLFETLTAAVIAGLTSMPVAVAAAVALGIVDQLGAWTFQNAAYVYLVQVIVVLVTLLVRREKLTRAVDAGISTWQAIRQVRPIPPELANRLPVRLSSSGLRLGILAVALCIPLFETPAHTQLVSIILIYSIVAASLVILTAWAGHISLGHIAFMGFGSAVTGILVANHGLNVFLAMAAGMAVSAGLAVLLGIPALRFGSGPYLAVVTLGLAVVANGYFFLPQYFPWLIPANEVPKNPLFGRLAIGTDSEMYYFCLIALVLVLAGVRGLRNSHAGRAMISSNDNRQATQSFAINTTRVQLMAFAISGALAGMAGGLYVVLEQGFNSGDYNPENGIYFFLMVVIGGLGSLPGAVLGAIFVYGAEYLLPNGYGALVTGGGVVIILMFIPGGLGEVFFNIRDYLLRAYAARHRLYVPSLVADVRVAHSPPAARPTAAEDNEDEAEDAALAGISISGETILLADTRQALGVGPPV